MLVLSRRLGESLVINDQFVLTPRTRTIAVCTAPEEVIILTESQTFDGSEVLRGLALPVRNLFSELDRIET